MTKFLSKWFRKFHRWLVWPFIVILLLILFSRNTPLGSVMQRIQAPLMITMAITGGYLWLLPYLTKWQRNRRAAAQKPSQDKNSAFLTKKDRD